MAEPLASPAPDTPDAPAISDEAQIPGLPELIDKVKTTLDHQLDEERLEKYIRLRVKRIKDWADWTPEAQLTLLHILGTQLIYMQSEIDVDIQSLDVPVIEHSNQFKQFLESLKHLPAWVVRRFE